VGGKLGKLFSPLRRASAPPPNACIVLIHDSFNPQMAAGAEQGIREALDGSDVALIVRPLDRKMEDRVAAIRAILIEERPMGVVLLPPSSDSDAIAALCRELGCGYVRLAATAIEDSAHCLTSHDRRAAADATNHLIADGHSLIGFVAGPEHDLSAREREMGFLDAMADNDLDRGATLIASGDYSFETGLAAGRLMLDVSPRPTAIFASNDGMAVGVLQAARELKLAVPAQLSIIGFGDTPIATRLDPELTSVHVPAWEMGHAAARRLIDPNAGREEPAHFFCKLVVRGSTARPGR